MGINFKNITQKHENVHTNIYTYKNALQERSKDIYLNSVPNWAAHTPQMKQTHHDFYHEHPSPF
jgi:hypothetical protein